MFKKIFLIVTFFLSTIYLYGNEVSANSLPIGVEPILPDNQVEDVRGYISIKEDGDSLKQVLEFKVINVTSEPQDITVNVVDAYSSPTGVIQYVEEPQGNSEIIDEKYKLSNYLTINNAEDGVIKLKPNEEKIIKTTLDVKEHDGVLLGGVAFSTLKEGNKVKEGESTFKINNKINMVIGVMVDFGTDKDVTIKVEEPYVDPMPAYYVVRFPVTLDTPELKEVKFNYKVKEKEKELFSKETKFNLAPMTKVNLALKWDYEEIEKNKPYVLEGELVYKDRNGKDVTEKIEKEFIYKGKDGDNNKNKTKNIGAPKEKTIIFNWTYILIALILVGTIEIIREYRKRKNKQQ